MYMGLEDRLNTCTVFQEKCPFYPDTHPFGYPKIKNFHFPNQTSFASLRTLGCSGVGDICLMLCSWLGKCWFLEINFYLLHMLAGENEYGFPF